MFLWLVSFVQVGFGQELTQTIRGVIVDQESGEPLFGATIFIPEIEKGVSSFLDGDFEFEKMPIGRYSLEISFVGYIKLVIPEILLESGKELVLEIELEKSNSELREVVVKSLSSNRINLEIASKEIFTIEETLRLPATFNDPARLAFAYAGVNGVNDQANHMVIRGNSPNNMNWQLEGVDIVNPNHLGNAGTQSDRPTRNGGGVNMLSAQMLGSSTLMRSAYPAEFSNSLSGIMNMNFRKGNNKKHEFTGQVGLIGMDFALEGPIRKIKNSSILLNIRYSTLGLLSGLGVNLGDESIRFGDLAFNYSVPFKKGGNLTVFGVLGTSGNSFRAKEDSLYMVEKDQWNIEYSSTNNLIGFTYSKILKDNIFWKNVGVFSRREDDYLVYGKQDLSNPNPFVEELVFDRLEDKKTSIKSFLEQTYLNKLKWRLGINYNYLKSNVQREQLSSGLLRPFGNMNVALGNINFRLGLSASYFFYNEQASLEPRAGVKWNLPKKQSLSFGYGLHSQILDPQIYLTKIGFNFFDTTFPNRDLNFLKAHHFNLKYEKQINQRTHLKVEGYYQYLFDIPISKDTIDTYSTINHFNNWEDRALVNEGTGKNFGIEVSAQQYFSENFFYLANVSLYESKYKGSDGVERDTRFNGNYIVNLTMGKEFRYKFEGSESGTIGVNFRVNVAGGMRHYPIDWEYSKEINTTVFTTSNGFSLQSKPYFKTDLRVYWKRNIKNITGTLSLDIQNVTNRKNFSFEYYDSFLEETIQKNQLGIIPILNYRIIF